MTTASASGKIILFGEHAVVYGRPALAVPLTALRARARVEDKRSPGLVIHARNLDRTFNLISAPAQDPLATITRAALKELNADPDAALDLWIDSDIPIAGGLGSGAAISTAIVRSLAAHLRQPLDANRLSALVFETEKLYHGTPSGIDNSVIALERPIRFTLQSGPQPIHIARPFTIAVANTGIASPTKTTVGDVRRRWQQDSGSYDKIFDEITDIVKRAQLVLALGLNQELGALMTRNQELLRALDVSSSEIELLLQAAFDAGSMGGKLSGGGRGGNVIVLVSAERKEAVKRALVEAGAKSVLLTTIQGGN